MARLMFLQAEITRMGALMEKLDANRNGVLAQLQESLPRAMAALQASGTALKEDLCEQGSANTTTNFS